MAVKHENPTPAVLPDDLALIFASTLPVNWAEVLQSRADASHLGDSKGTRDLLRATAVYLRQLMTPSGSDHVEADRIPDDQLAKMAPRLREQIRLLETRLARSAIPEDSWDYGSILAEARLKLALVSELLEIRATARAIG